MRILKIFANVIIHQAFVLILLILSLWGSLSILIGTQTEGIGIVPDSVNYIAAARNIANGNGITSFTNKPLTMFPPLYPVCLGVIDVIFNIDPLTSVLFVNAILFGLVIFTSGILMYKYLNLPALYSLGGIVVILVGIPIVKVSQLAITELLFILFLVFYLIATETFLKKNNTISLIILSLIVALACLTRYIGVILIFTGIINIFSKRNKCLITKVRQIFIFSAITTIPLFAFLLRNYLSTGAAAGYRDVSKLHILHNIGLAVNTIYYWYVPTDISLNNLTLIVLMIIMGILTILLLRNKFNFKIL